MISFATKTVINAVAIWVAAWLVSGISLTGGSFGRQVATVLLVAVIFGLVNFVIKPVVKLFSLPLFLLTLGLITFVINGLMLWLTSWLCGKLSLNFQVHGFWHAILGAIIISVVAFVLHAVVPERDK